MAPSINLLHRLPAGREWLEVTIDLEPSAFGRQHVRDLREKLAELSDLPAAAIRVRGIARWQPIVTLEMPRAGAEKLVRGFERSDRRLVQALAALPVRAIVPVSPEVYLPKRAPAFQRRLAAANAVLLAILIVVVCFRLASCAAAGPEVSGRASPAPTDLRAGMIH